MIFVTVPRQSYTNILLRPNFSCCAYVLYRSLNLTTRKVVEFRLSANHIFLNPKCNYSPALQEDKMELVYVLQEDPTN